MFGYIIPDKPNMYMKDYTLYRAYYCGLCKGIGKECGQLMRFSTNYDVTFLSLFVDGVLGNEVEIKQEGCILAPLKKKAIVAYDTAMSRIVDVNTILAHYKCRDDARDGSGAKGAVDVLIVKRKLKRAAKREPVIYAAAEKYFAEQARLESESECSADKVAHPFAEMLRVIVQELTGGAYTDAIGNFIYQLGRLVYFMDAVDDAEEDASKNEYNVFLRDYVYTDRETFIKDKGEELSFILNSCYAALKAEFANIPLAVNDGVATNIVWLGIPRRIGDVLGRNCKCKKIRI